VGTTPFRTKKKVKGGTKEEQALFDGGDYLEIEHVPTGYTVKFSAFIENFSDAYNSEWTAEQVYGRMDPIATFMHTRRAIAVSWNIPAASMTQAKQNLSEVGKLISFLYPVYADRGDVNDSTVMNMAPLVRVRFGNLIQNSETEGGLLGYLNGFTTDIDFNEQGVFAFSSTIPDAWTGTEEALRQAEPAQESLQSDKIYYPRNIVLNFEMNVLHEHSLGWQKGAQGKYFFRGGRQGFPYGPARLGPPSKNFEVRPKPQSTTESDTPDPIVESEEKKALE
jgi:hypothetical protein